MSSSLAVDHKHIRILFSLGDKQFEAVGFLDRGETECDFAEAMSRADNGHIVSEIHDWNLLFDGRKGIAPRARDFLLWTQWQDTTPSPYVATLVRQGRGDWFHGWNLKVGKLGPQHLVVRVVQPS